MPKPRLTRLFLAGTTVAAAAVLILPVPRHRLQQALFKGGSPVREAGSTSPGRDAPALSASTSDQQNGPGKITARATEDFGSSAAVDSSSSTASFPAQASAAQTEARRETEVDPPAGPSLVQANAADAIRARQAIAFYRKGDLAAGDAVARTAANPLVRTALEWTAIRLQPQQAGLAREDAFAAAHADWPSLAWLKRRIEEAVAAQKDDITGSIGSRLAGGDLQTVAGKLARAKLDRARGDAADARAAVKAIWRNGDLTPWQESFIGREFGDVVDRADHKFRADRLLYKEQVQPALREATLAGPDVLALAKARAAVINNSTTAAVAIAAVPKSLSADPGLTFSRIQRARRANRIDEAAALMLSAPRDPQALIDGDQWWIERRLVARKLLDRGDAQRAYRIAAEHTEASPTLTMEAEFHAGWIALRFLDDPKRAAGHFATLAKLAETPISRTRATYWQGRTAEAAGDPGAAAAFYAEAARYPITFYGQLATAKVGASTLALRTPTSPAVGARRADAVQVAEFLFGIGARDVALPLSLDVARNEPSEAQVAAMGAVVEQVRDAWATLAVGKAATQRGMALDTAAFPTFGIPEYQPLRNSADLAVVYAIARQESEFDQRSQSQAGAKGLMQMISSTARRTAEHAGVGYDDARLSSDAAFNAQLGAAHLGELLDENGGSYILTFAAYNAGGKNVKDWVEAYGDPRKPGVDPIDWIERIPFTETRNYVQRVLENVQIYRLRLGRPAVTAAKSPDPLPNFGRGT